MGTRCFAMQQGNRGRPQTFRKAKPDWDNRHQVMVSKQNDGMHSFYRNYFDQQREILQNGKVVTDPADEPAVSPRLRSIIHDQSDRTQLLPRGAHGSMSVRHFKNPRPPRDVIAPNQNPVTGNPETMPSVPRTPRLPSRGAQCPRTPRGLRCEYTSLRCRESSRTGDSQHSFVVYIVVFIYIPV